MDEDAVGKLLPNLKITLGNNSDSDDQKEEGEISDTLDTPEKVVPEKETTKKNVGVNRAWMKTLQNPKVYENKDGGFITGLDLSSEVLIKKLEKRAERFGLEKIEGPITQKEIDALYKSLGIEPENLNSCKLKNIRLDALHMRGVEEMSTKDIFSYFGDYGAKSVEWINDCSCNVVWLDTATTARAMIGMSKAFVVKKKAPSKPELPESLNEEEAKTSEIEAVIEMSDSEESDDTNKKSDEMEETSMDIDEASENKPVDVDSEALDVPVPPGHWRLGLPHEKAKAILLRFATKDDKKLPGAEKRSQYYQKYGNPNYGGIKGLLTSTRKRRIQTARTRQVIEKFADESTSQQDIAEILNSGDASTKPAVRTSRTKMPRMRMYADDEEEKKKKTFIHHESDSNPKSVHSRLGTKYTRDELFTLGRKFSSETEDEEDDDVAINCTVPSSRFIWNGMAGNMAQEEEDTYKPRSYSPPDLDTYEYKEYRNFAFASRKFRSSRDFGSSRDSRSSRDFGSSRDSRSFRDPPSQRPSHRSYEDLRSTLSSSQKKGVISERPREDLRSKIKGLQKDDSFSKHRSPLCKDD